MTDFHASEYVAFLHTVTPENLVSNKSPILNI